MLGQLLDWLEQKAANYLRWCAERRAEVAAVCPDCEAPMHYCYCDEKARQDAIAQGAYELGRDHEAEGYR